MYSFEFALVLMLRQVSHEFVMLPEFEFRKSLSTYFYIFVSVPSYFICTIQTTGPHYSDSNYSIYVSKMTDSTVSRQSLHILMVGLVSI